LLNVDVFKPAASKQSFLREGEGGYIEFNLSVHCLSLCLVSATPLLWMNWYWWNFTQLLYTPLWSDEGRELVVYDLFYIV